MDEDEKNKALNTAKSIYQNIGEEKNLSVINIVLIKI